MKRLLVVAWLVGVIFFIHSASGWADDKNGTNKGKEAIEMDQIVVTATRTPHLLKDVPVETVVITRKDIERSSAQTISDLLRNVPGIFIRAENVPGISAWRAKIRGLDFNSGYGLILINGQRVKGGGMGEYGLGLNQIPLEMIERIEIVKGPSSVLYGSDALAGVVNIITKSAPQKPSFGLEVASGSRNVRIGNAWFGGQLDRFGGIINLNHEESDCGKYGYRSGREEDYYRNRLDSNYFVNLSKNTRLSLGVSLEDWDRKRKYSNGVRRHTEKNKYRFSPALNVKLNDGSRLKLQGYWFDWDFKTKERGGSSHFTPTDGDMYYKQTEVQYTKPLGEHHLFTGGAEWLEEKLDYNLATKVIITRSAYLQDEIYFTVGKPVTLVLGGRVDDHSVFGSEFCPKLSLMIEATPQTRVRASIGRGFKSPNIRQMYYEQPFHHGTYWYKSNPNLDAERSWGYSVGIEQSFNKRWLFGLTFFRNDVKDKVVWVETDETIYGEPVKTAKNIAKCHTQGVEASLKAKLLPGLSTILGYTYLDTEDEDTHKDLTYSPKNTINARLIYEYTPWGITASIGTQYVDEMYKDTRNTKKTDDYFLTDMKLTKKITKYASISIEGNNIFNTNYGEPERDWEGATWLVRLTMNF